ncbi:hypothetical protein HDV05_004916 [Chytridiales sp. JEL 0842]|nr:hypothetical protein HDV05_004916 [Chytridiales sp. JEL 0842]
MFGCIVAGRLVQTNLQQVDVTKYMFELQDAKSINHIVVFLTGQQAFPPGYAATVHFLWPNPSAPPTWQFLGYLSNEKPSAVFRLGLKKSSTDTPTNSNPNLLASGLSTDSMLEDSSAIPTEESAFPLTASVGISIEPMETVMRAVQELQESKVGGSAMMTDGSGIGGGDGMALVSASAAKMGDWKVLVGKLMESFYK